MFKLKSSAIRYSAMTIDEKVRYGMVALAGAGVALTALGFHAAPLAEAGGGAGL
jgi:hypothetical protein